MEIDEPERALLNGEANISKAFQVTRVFCRRHRETVWPDEQIVFSIFGHLQQWKFAQKYTNWAKVS